jgi:hypothetical protein
MEWIWVLCGDRQVMTTGYLTHPNALPVERRTNTLCATSFSWVH